jgi:hypothetical protein
VVPDVVATPCCTATRDAKGQVRVDGVNVGRRFTTCRRDLRLRRHNARLYGPARGQLPTRAGRAIM